MEGLGSFSYLVAGEWLSLRVMSNLKIRNARGKDERKTKLRGHFYMKKTAIYNKCFADYDSLIKEGICAFTNALSWFCCSPLPIWPINSLNNLYFTKVHWLHSGCWSFWCHNAHQGRETDPTADHTQLRRPIWRYLNVHTCTVPEHLSQCTLSKWRCSI